MAAKKSTAQAAVKQPAASKTAEGSAKQSKEREPAKDGNLPNDNDQGAPEGGVVLEVVTRLERRIRAGVVVTQVPQTVTVSEEAAELIEADPHISATRK